MIFNVLVIKINYTTRINYPENLTFSDKSIVITETDNILDTMEAIYRGNIDILFLPDSRGVEKSCLYIRMIKAYYDSLDLVILTQKTTPCPEERTQYIRSGAKELLNAYDFKLLKEYIINRRKRLKGAIKLQESWSECTSAAMILIKQNYHKALPLEAIVEESGYSYSSVCHSIRRDTGRSPKEWLNKWRSDSAAELLISTRMPVKEIAHNCGFTTTQGFINAFKRGKGGLTPQQFRKMNKRKIYGAKEEE